MPKDRHGNLDRAAVRYALHRYFMQRHGWFVKGLRPADSTDVSTEIMMERVPAYISDLFEHRLDQHGFGMHELAVFAATLEDLVRQEARRTLGAAYDSMRVNLTDRVPAKVVDVILDTYMMAYVVGANLSIITPGRFRAAELKVKKIYPSWPETRTWLRDLRIGMEHTDLHRRNPFLEGMDFRDATEVIDAIGDRFGPFQAIECHDLKAALVNKEHRSTGRVRLSQFYTKTEGVQWDFTESVEYLRHLGALDETDPEHMSVVIPNYVNSLTNCIAASNFYSVCCRDECEDLLDHLEEQIAAPEATPERIAELVARLPSDTVEAPRNLSATLLSRLGDIADHSGGRVPLHGRLFSQWMHHTYPRECSFPQPGAATGQLTLLEWIKQKGRAGASPEELQRHRDALGREELDLNFTAEAPEDILPWAAVEELVFSRPAPARLGSSILSLRNAVFLAAVAAVGGVVWRDWLGAPDAKVERHFV